MNSRTSFTFLLLIFVLLSKAHLHHYPSVSLHDWKTNKGTVVKGSFLMIKEGQLYIESAGTLIVKQSLNELAADDLQLALDKQKQIDAYNVLNHPLHGAGNTEPEEISVYDKSGILILGAGLITFLLFRNRFWKLLVPFLSLCCSFGFFSFGRPVISQQLPPTNPLTIDSAFSPFKPEISTYWNATYFSVESKGIPTTHPMMAGISDSGWQRQVPIPQCYVGANSWSIPLNPVIAVNPVPVNQNHFTKGAIAIAVNGVPIFNPYTNTGVDAFLDGQLDAYGGHSGRADDYHYHIAPLHLYNYTAVTLPVAYAFDGFAVYGSFEPDGSVMQTLDGNHGHYWTNGVYHYHGSANAPYMIGNMVGQVTEDASLQIVPQAVASAVRPPQNPLPGALISSCVANAAGNGYNLTYTLAGQTDSLVYSWTGSGVYDFKLYTPSGYTDSVYNGFVQCNIASGISNQNYKEQNLFAVFPNPVGPVVNVVATGDGKSKANVQYVILFDVQGKEIKRIKGFVSELNTTGLAEGVYFLNIVLQGTVVTKKIVVR